MNISKNEYSVCVYCILVYTFAKFLPIVHTFKIIYFSNKLVNKNFC